MRYTEPEKPSENHERQVTGVKRKMSRRRRRRCVMRIILAAILIFGIGYAVLSVIETSETGDSSVPQSGETRNDSPSNPFYGNDTLGRLKALAGENNAIEAIVGNADAYPESLLALLADNQETLSFVQDYPTRSSGINSSGLTQDDLIGEIPLFLQWDKRWGYEEYGNDMLAITGCGPTSLSMVIVGLTGDLTADPGAVAAFSQANGYCVDGNGTDWGLMTLGAESYGLTATELPLWENNIIEQLQNGHPVICIMGPGVFTTTGHFIVIYGYENGEFLINDSNSIARSKQRWTYASFENQVRNLWAYSIN